MANVNISEFRGMTMKKIVAKRLAPITAGGVNYTTVPQDPQESARNQAIAGFWNGMNFRGMNITRVVLPHDAQKNAVGDNRSDQVAQAQGKRQAEWNRQSAMPWGSQFMHTGTDAQRLNNPAMESFVSQRQLTVPSTYGQFYAFMHALSAAFGNLNTNG